jgi:hypothetical protein
MAGARSIRVGVICTRQSRLSNIDNIPLRKKNVVAVGLRKSASNSKTQKTHSWFTPDAPRRRSTEVDGGRWVLLGGQSTLRRVSTAIVDNFDVTVLWASVEERMKPTQTCEGN